eukprot:6787830-Heterocapsa_arctica.AAC.1
MRHLEVKRLWLQEETKQKWSVIEHIPGDVNAADLLTKALHRPRYVELSTLLGLRNGDLTVDNDDGDEDNVINVLEFYRAPRCLR